MLASDIPVKIDIPFARDAGQFVDQVPDASPGIPGRASFRLGFPPETMEPIEVGGTPPFGQDMNGILNQSTAWLRWQAAGGPVYYDAAFQTNVAGYPQGALIMSADGLGQWFSLQDNNVTNPDTGGSGWLFVPYAGTHAGDPNGVVTGHAATSVSPPSLLWDSTNLVWWRSTGTTTWVALLSVNPVTLLASGVHNYVAADNGKVFIRSNAGSNMSDALPNAGSVTNGWGVTVFNGDASAQLTLTCTTGINGVALASVTLQPRQSIKLNADASGNFWSTVPPIPQVFSGQAVYVNVNGTYPPGVYDVDTSAGPVTFQLELGGVQGDNYVIRDISGTFAKNNCVIDPNGRTIEGQSGNFACDVPFTQFLLSRNVDTDYSLI